MKKLGLIFTLSLSLTLFASFALAATVTVSTVADEFDAQDSGSGCSLREALETLKQQNDFGGCLHKENFGQKDTILFEKHSTYSPFALGSGPLKFSKDLTLRGEGSSKILISGNDKQALFEIAAKVEITGVTLNNGRSSENGGCILNQGSLILDQVTLTQCVSENAGGAIWTSTGSQLELRHTILKENVAKQGGAIANEGNLKIVQSVLWMNQAVEGGGIWNKGELGIENSTLSGNKTESGQGGAVFQAEGKTLFDQTTLAQNQASKGSALFVAAGMVDFKNSLIAENGNSSQCVATSGAINSQGYNLSSDKSCNLNSELHDQAGIAAKLIPLTENGGNTYTHALSVDSPALDAIPLENCKNASEINFPRDQRGTLRQDSHCDIGAYEMGEVIADKSTLDFGNTPIGEQSRKETLTFQNNSNSTVRFNELIFSKSEGFSVIEAEGNCQSGKSLEVGEKCSVTLIFEPKGSGKSEAQLEIRYTPQGSAPLAKNFSLSGTAPNKSAAQGVLGFFKKIF